MGSIAHAVDSIDEICAIHTERGGAEYGDECVTQRAHALQCAQLAEGAGANPAPITAALAHDIGQLEHFLRYMVASLRVVG
jgi:predicted HD phosphohydrolase